jgi:hypothetical protein
MVYSYCIKGSLHGKEIPDRRNNITALLYDYDYYYVVNFTFTFTMAGLVLMSY